MSKFYTERELEESSDFAKSVCENRKNNLNPVYYDEYTNWQTENKKSYDNFMKLTSQPQNNPYGIAGNHAALKKLELQKPNREPTRNNPFMNPEIQSYNIPQRFGKAQSHCGTKCKKNFYEKLLRSPDDALFERQASERQFYTVPNSSVPNEQKKFAEWLYGNNYVGKSGSIYDRYGYPYTPDSLVNTGFNAASPQNAGQSNNNFGVPNTQGASPFVNNPNYGYGFGGIPGAIPYHNIIPNPPSMQTNPQPFFPTFPQPIPSASQGSIPPNL